MKYFHIILVICSLNAFAQNDCAKVDMNFTGYCTEFYPNGKTKWVKEFEEGQAVGMWMNFDEKGNLLKQLNTTLKLDSLNKIYEETFHIDLNDTMIYTFVEEEAKFKGNLNEFIVENLDFRSIGCGDFDFNHKIYFKFVVEMDGSVSNFVIVRGIPNCPQCEGEVERMAKSMPPWKPAKNKGKTVRSWCQIPINFTLH